MLSDPSVAPIRQVRHVLIMMVGIYILQRWLSCSGNRTKFHTNLSVGSIIIKWGEESRLIGAYTVIRKHALARELCCLHLV
jgi:hypothetical protein